MYRCLNIILNISKQATVPKNNLKNAQINSFRYIFTMGSMYIQKGGLPNYHPDAKDMAAAGDRTGSARDQNEKGNGLLLYLNHYSFYAQKVIMALIEKRLPFKTHVVNIVKGEQYKPWFLEINPRGEVPVLKDGVKIIPDSARIIDYLEDNFSNGDTLRLIPMDQGPEVRQKVIHFRNILDQIPANVVTLGSFYHTKFVHKPRMPFIAPVRKQLAGGEEKSIQRLRELAEIHPEIKDILLEKAEVQEKKHNIIVSEEQFAKLLDQVDGVLKEIETELSSRSDDDKRWLCSERFTVADVSLTILLDRLYRVGLDEWFWGNNKKPALARYYKRVQQRDSYKKTIPSNMVHMKTFFEMQSGFVIGTVIFTALAVVIGGFILLKKK